MSNRQAQKTSAKPGKRSDRVRQSPGRRLAIALLIVIALAGAVALTRRNSEPHPPAIATAGLEPMIVSQIENGIAEVRRTPRVGASWGRLGMILQAHEFTAEAQDCFKHAQRFAPAEARWLYLHALLLSEEDAAGALVRMRRAVDLAPASTDAPQLRLAQWLFENGRLDEAEGHFKKLLQASPGHAPARLGLAEVSQTRGQLEDALRMIEPCLTNAYTARRAHLLLGQVERRLGRPSAAEATTHRVASLPPDWPWPDLFSAEAAQYRIGRKAWTEQVRQFLDQGRPEAAQPLIARLTRDYANAPEGWLLLGRAQLERNDCAGAEQGFRRALQLAPDSVNGLAQLGAALLCQERHADAVPVFQRVVQLKPDFGEAHFNLGLALGRAGRPAEAFEPFRSAIRYSPNFADPYVTLADLLIQKGEREEAGSLLRRALQLNPSDERAKILWQRLKP